MLAHLILAITASAVQVPEGFTVKSDWQPTELSTYHRRFDGRRTASGDIYRHMSEMTAATVRKRGSTAPRIPFGTYVQIKSKQGRTIVVKINDTGSYRPRQTDQWFDLSGLSWKTLYPDTEPSRFMGQYRILEKTR